MSESQDIDQHHEHSGAQDVEDIAPQAIGVRLEDSAAPQERSARTPEPQPTPKPHQPSLTKPAGASSMNPYIAQISQLAQELKPPVSPSGQWQFSLFSILRSILEDLPADQSFDEHWGAVLGFFRKAKDTAMVSSFILKPGDDWAGSEQDFSIFRRLLWVIEETTEPNTRARALSRLNMSRATEGLSEQARNRLLSFYG